MDMSKLATPGMTPAVNKYSLANFNPFHLSTRMIVVLALALALAAATFLNTAVAKASNACSPSVVATNFEQPGDLTATKHATTGADVIDENTETATLNDEIFVNHGNDLAMNVHGPGYDMAGADAIHFNQDIAQGGGYIQADLTGGGYGKTGVIAAIETGKGRTSGGGYDVPNALG